MRPGDPRAEPTPRTRAGQESDSAPAPLRAAPAQCGRIPNPGTAGTKLPHHPRAQGSSMPRAGQGERWGRGPLIPAPPPAPSLGLGLAQGLGPRAQPGVGRCVRAGQGTRAGARRGRASHCGRCSSRHPGRWPSRATGAPHWPPVPQPGSPRSTRLAPVARASGPWRNCAGRADRRAGPAKLAGLIPSLEPSVLGRVGPRGLYPAPQTSQHRPSTDSARLVFQDSTSAGRRTQAQVDPAAPAPQALP